MGETQGWVESSVLSKVTQLVDDRTKVGILINFAWYLLSLPGNVCFPCYAYPSLYLAYEGILPYKEECPQLWKEFRNWWESTLRFDSVWCFLILTPSSKNKVCTYF